MPKAVEREDVLVCVHALPKAPMLVRHDLVLARKALERFVLQNIVATEIVEHAPVKDEKSSVDPLGHTRLLVEPRDTAVRINPQDSELGKWLHGRERGHSAMADMKIVQGPQVQGGDSIAVGGEERIVDIRRQLSNTATRISLGSSI